MKKKLQFCISLVLILSMCVGFLTLPAASYETDYEPSSDMVLLINMDTDTEVYSDNASKTWYMGNLSEIMTFIIVMQNVSDPENTLVKVKKAYIDLLDYSDGCLKNLVEQPMSYKDLLAVMLLTHGNDAAMAMAHFVSGGRIDVFVEMMNRKAVELGCKKTVFTTPGVDPEAGQLTTCEDLSRIYSCAMQYELFNEIMAENSYVPELLGKEYEVSTINSIMSAKSPYYFRYVTGGKYSYDREGGAALVATTRYRNMTYLFVALKGMNGSEMNVFVDCKRMTTWAYLNLSDRKLVNAEEVVGTAATKTPWGEGEIRLAVPDAGPRTIPNSYNLNELTMEPDIPEYVSLPVFRGQNIGTAGIYYEKEKIDEVNLVSMTSEGLSLLSDLSSFLNGGLSEIMPIEPEPETVVPTEPATADDSDLLL